MVFGYVSALLLVSLVVTDYTPFNVVEGKNISPYTHFIAFNFTAQIHIIISLIPDTSLHRSEDKSL